jgi:hypothetical protein
MIEIGGSELEKYLKILLFLLLIPAGLFVLFYGGFFAFIIASDQASYNGNEVYIGPIDYDSALANAEKAGYDVSGPWTKLDGTNTIEPGNVESLEKMFKSGYRVHRIELYYNETQKLEFCKYDSPNVYVTQMGSGYSDDTWMLEMFRLVFGLDEKGSEEYLERLKNGSRDTELSQVQMMVNESVDFPAVYTYLNRSSTKTVFNPGMWKDEEFYRDEKMIGYIAYIVPETTISTSHQFNKYSVDVSSSGFVRANILMHRASTGNKINKEEYTTVFKKMFKNLGLPVEMVDKFDFEYSPSVW